MTDKSPTAFHMTTVAGHLSLDDITRAAAHRDSNFETPVLQLLSDSKAKGYDAVCIPLTNEKWRERWKGMCLSPEDEAEKDPSVERTSEAWRSNPAFLREEVNVTRLGGFVESSRRYCTLTRGPEQMKLRIRLPCFRIGLNSIRRTSG